MTKHTPGPWKVTVPSPTKLGAKVDVYAVEPPPKRGVRWGVCVLEAVRKQDAAEQVANARLIAAAPELLDALKAMLDRDTGSYCEWCEAHAPKDDLGNVTGAIYHRDWCQGEQARAAIAKAEDR